MAASEDRTSPGPEGRAEGEEVDRVLVPFEVLGRERPQGSTPDLVQGMEIVLLGYHYLPLQTAPPLAREDQEDEARQRLDELAAAYRQAGAKVTTRLAFVHDPERAIARAADQDTCGAVLLARPSDQMEEVLVPIPGEAHLPRLLDVVASVVKGGVGVTLTHVVEDEDRIGEAELLVEGAEEKLVERGIPAERISQKTILAEERLEAIAEEAGEHDGLVLGEFERALREAVFGEVHERVARHYAGPILLVRRAIEAEGPEVQQERLTSPEPDE